MTPANARSHREDTAWRGDRAAMFVLSFDVDAESVIWAIGRRYAEHPMTMSHQTYGPTVGVPRILDLLDEYNLKATFFVPGQTADLYPACVENIVTAGHEVGHHSYSHRSPCGMSDAEERQDFERAMTSLDRLGVKPVGYRAAMWDPSWRSADLVAEHGLLYDSSLMDDDRPYVIETSHGEIAELPPHWSLDDWLQYFYLPDPAMGQNIESGDKVYDLWRGELDGMRRHNCLFMLTNHPFISGRPGRVETLRRLVEHAIGCGDVGFATAAEVARRVLGDAKAPRRKPTQAVVDEGAYPVH
jgi:peptidoglycan/xylan/chitin deacetylase (PgdA/CDA1 family)